MRGQRSDTEWADDGAMPAAKHSRDSRPWQLLMLSAASDAGLEAATRALVEHLRQRPQLRAEDVAYTLHSDPRPGSKRRVVTCRNLEDAVACLEILDPERVLTASEVPSSGERPVGFLFPGQGAQHVGMGRELYETEPTFRAQLDRCSQLVSSRLGCELPRLLYPAAGEEAAAARLLGEMRLSQPALFAVEYALARLWIEWGVAPRAMLGHSLGEHVAACLAGVFSLEEGLVMVSERGRLMQTTPAGAMLSVSLPEAEIVPLLGEELSLAAINAPALCAVSGPVAAIEALEQELALRGLECRRLRVAAATHSRLMEPVVEPLVEEVAKARLRPPQIPFLSNVTGSWIRDEEATDPGYWGRHLCEPVRFTAGLSALAEEPGGVLLEVGPGQMLTALARRHPAAASRPVLASMRHPRDPGSDVAFLLDQVGRLWLGGVAVDPEGFYAGRRRRRLERPERPERIPPPPAGARRGTRTVARTPLEEVLAGIWEEVLAATGASARPVGVHDNFFALGGDSLTATQILSRVRRTLGVTPALRSLFERPTVAGLGDVVAAMLRRIDDVGPPLRPAKRGATVPASFAQRRLWFLDRFEPDSALYNVPVALHLQGRLDPAALAGALNAIVRRHEVLRTSFEAMDGEPHQVIRPRLELPLPVLDLTGLSAAERRRAAECLALAEAREPFDLTAIPLLRTTLLRLDAGEHLLLVTMHHIVSDRWSIRVLVDELSLHYQAFAAGRRARLPELGVQYADFALWQRQWLAGDVLEGQLAYWREQLAGVPGLELVTDRPRPEVQSSRGGVERFPVPAERASRLREIGRRHGCTPFMTLLAAFLTLLERYSGQEELAVGSVIAGRNRAETEPLVGFFVNTLVLRADLRGDPTFSVLLARVRDLALAAHAHQDLPFEKLVEELAPERHLGRNPLVQVLFVLQNLPAAPPELAPDLALELGAVDTGTAKFDLSLVFEPQAGGLRGDLEYCTELFDATTIRRMQRHLETLLAGIADDPEARLSQLPLAPAAERHQLLLEWNVGPSAAPSPEAGLVHELFEARAAATPEAVAVLGLPDQHLSYRELNRRASGLARDLRRQGVGPEVLVGISMERSVEWVVALIGVLRSGGAFVPLDPSFPEKRRTFMMRDTGISELLTADGVADGVARANDAGGGAYHPSSVPVSRSRGGSKFALACPNASDAHPAYVIYTSGSTGRPKGVVVAHGALAGHCRTIRRELGLQPGDRVLQSASFHFDVALEQTLPALLSGAQLVVAERDPWLPSQLSGKLRELGITVADLPAGYWRQWVGESAARPAAAIRPLRAVSVGGEVMPAESACRWGRTPLATVELINAYGPTEATITATLFRVPNRAPELSCRHRVPIGRPLAERSCHVVDRYGRPVPIGVPGELCLGGALLARGYLGRPARSAEHFVPDPRSREPGARCYRTGDLVRWRGDGNLDFLGRIDAQVKVRGFRIELGEIEAVLAAHPGIRESAVVAAEAAGDRQLVAWFVAEGGVAPRAGELRARLRQALPRYMVPALFVALEALPRLPNGKVDRAALGRRTLPSPQRWPELGWVAPRNPCEEILAGIWEEVLGRDRVGVDDNFFDLGGHSLLATQVLSRMREPLGIEPPLRVMFEQPTVAGLAAHVAAARGREEELGAPPLRPRPRPPADPGPPLSFAQQRLWFLDQLEPGSTLYNVPMTLYLRGRLDRAALARAAAEIVRRHEVLRTTYEIAGSEPVQVIRPAVALPLPFVDLARLAEPGRRREARRLALREARRVFDLRRGPLLRAALVRLGPQQHDLLLTIHHIAFDGWSTGVLLHELAALYRAASDADCGLPELRVQYADFAVWQRQWLAGEVLERRLAYWRRQLAGLPVLELPADRPRPAVQSFRGAVVPFRWPAELGRRLQECSRQHRSSRFMTLLAAFQMVAGRYAGEDDLAVGAPVANRNRAEIEGLLGCFVNTLVLRADLSGGPSFGALLARTREVALHAYAHQDLPFEKLVEELEPERDLSRNPLVQVLFVLQNAPAAARELAPGLAVELGIVDAGTAKFDLSLFVEEDAQALAGKLEFNTDLFDATTIRRLAGHFRNVLETVAADPERRLSELSLLSAVEARQLLVEWNDTAWDPGREGCLAPSLPRLFELQAEATCEAIAVVSGEWRLSYGELNRRANRLAHALRALGVGPEIAVGIGMERSAEMVVAILGVLKSGGAYLPLDPDYPAERLAFMLDDARARVLVTRKQLLAALPEHRARGVCLDADADRRAIAEHPATDPAPLAGAANLAYLIYTSGSTGRAKGVAIAHRSAVVLLEWARQAFAPEELAGVLASTSICFDLSVFELFAPLSRGGTAILAANALELPELAAAPAVTLVNTVPSALRELVRLGGLPDSVRTVNLAGEALGRELVEGAYRQPGVERVLNLYGPSEDTTYSTWARLQRGGTGPPPIGRPLAATRAYVLDRHQQPLPPGVPGELYLGGEGLARCYLARPELTAERFQPDPLSEQAGARRYRTGDLVRALPGGELAFLGRLDHQIKLRGFRIEPGEIEAVLAAHPQVRETVVVAREEPAGPRLVAYLVFHRPQLAASACREPLQGRCSSSVPRTVVAARPGAPAPQAELRAYLRETLPEHMVPSAFAILESLPRTPTGKVDRAALGRRALPAPERDRSLSQAPYVAPRNALEEELARIWSRWLGIDKVGAHDHFFTLGGHSLLATQVISEMPEVFGVELPLRRLFERPILAELAAAIAEMQAARAEKETSEPLRSRIRPRPRDGDPPPLSFSQLRQWLLNEIDPGSADFNIPGGVRLCGPLEPAALARSIREIVGRHQALRTTFRRRDEEPVQVIAPPGEVPLPRVDLSRLRPEAAEQRVRRLAAEEANRPFDLERGPLLRVSLLRLASAEHVLLFTMHHIVSDGWSLGIFLRELGILYQAFTTGDAASLPSLPIQYADFALWQRQTLRGEVLERLASYWRERLAGAPPFPELPTDRPRPAIADMRGARRSRRLEAPLTRGLGSLSRRHGASLFMVLTAGLKALLHRYTGRRDLSVGTFIANRNRSEVAELIGFFVNTLVLRTDLGGNPTFPELLAREREVTLGAYEHQDLPFETLLEVLQPERSTSYTPLFQVLLVLQNVPGPELRLRDVKLDFLPPEVHRANFDLSLFVTQAAGACTLSLGYPTALFDGTTILRLLGHYRTLLEAVLAYPETAISELALLSPGERRQLLTEWTATAADYPREAVIHRLIAAQLGRTPDAVAVEDASGRLSYGELLRRSNRLADRLRRLGVGPESVVAMALERSPEMVVALLGILKAGGAYLPLDPGWPPQRLRLLLADSGARVLVTREPLRKRFPGVGEVLIEAADERCREPVPESSLRAQNLAYVIYTSGSTGRPKGVLITHRSLVHHTVEAAREYAITPADRLLQFASASFDASAEEIYPCLIRGATLVLRNDEMLASAPAFFREIARRRISVLNLPTAFWHQLTRELSGLALPESLRLVILGGEKASAERLAIWRREIGPWPRLVNTYGPTEATIVATRCDAALGTASGEVAIGRPLANLRAYVPDPRLEPLAVGVDGELHLAGAGLARGYLARPALTAERFIPDPWSARPGARLYKTGDRVRYLADGNLEFRGRVDQQLKIRGFRIEPGEIEALLDEHEAVREAVVVAREIRGDRRLVAYLVASSEAPSAGELHGFLRAQLPEHMVPSSFVFLDELPHTSAGKIDRRALPAPGGSRPELAHAYRAPRTPIEEVLAGIGGELLGLERVGVDDNFFELGGHSLLAAQFAARARSSFGVEVPLVEIFHHPTVAGIARLVESAERAHAPEIPPLRRAERDGAIPLSFPQERIWFLEQLTPGNLAYNFQVQLHFRGALDLAALESALSEIVRRHEIYCTTFPAMEGRPVQRVHPPWPVTVPVVDLRALPAAERPATAAELAHAATQIAFDVTRLPLLRWTLLRLEDEYYRLVQVEHHLVHDGWSLAVLLREMQELYGACLRGEPSPLPELPVQFADFAIWQRRRIRGEVLEGLLAYWREKLTGLPPSLELPADRPRPRRNRMRGTAFQISPSPELLRAIRRLGRRRGFTLYMTMLAAFYTFLHRYSGQTELAVGAGVANRRLRESEGLIGMIVNTLVLRTDLGGNPDFWELLARVRRTTLEAYAHQDMPFGHLVSELQPERDPSRNPLFQVLFAFHDSPMPYPDFAGLTTKFRGLHNRSAKTDLNVVVVPEGEQHAGMSGDPGEEEPLGIIWEYSTDLFDATTARRMAHHYLTLLERVVATPERRIGELALLADGERHQLLAEWNVTNTDYPRQSSIHALFEARVAATPEAVAVVFGRKALSYQELNLRANRLAHHLRRLGLEREAPVGLVPERSCELVTAVVGILKAGGAYVPLDPINGEERLALMMRDTGIRVLVTTAAAEIALAGVTVPRVVRLDADRTTLARESTDNPEDRVAAGNLAYVMYTSGSTGTPKGVSVCHRSVVRLVRATDFARFGPDEVFLQFAPVSFDASTLELWGPLLSGGRLVIAPPGKLSLEELAATIARSSVTTLWLTAGLFHRMTEELGLRQLESVRQLLAGGDVLSLPHVRRVLEELPGCTLINGYGPTENTTFTCCHPLTEVAEVGIGAGSTVPIGVPIANTRVRVLDRHLQPVPVGVPGELYAAGDGLARGYLHRPDLTAERFVPNPVAASDEEVGERLYRTGDLVRYRPDGRLEFLGRNDFQVKVRGFRIELGEIEIVLRQHPAVRECALLAREDLPGDRRLVAYVVPAAAAAEAADPGPELREFLRQKLPEYMVPAAFVMLAILPLTANGKLDRRALPAPDYAGREETYAEPRTPLEESLAAFWSEVLGIARVGIEDDFFELGGHSLLATQVVSRVRERYGVKVPLEEFFAAATVAGLAAFVERLREPDERHADDAAERIRASEPQEIEDLLMRAETMPDEELDALLQSVLSGEER